MTANRFEDLDAWTVAHELANLVYVYSREMPLGKDYGFKEQKYITEEQFQEA